METDGPLHAREALVAAQAVGPLEGPVVDILGPFEQCVDEPGALVGTIVLEERDDLFGRGDEADDVEVDASAELGVVAQPRRGDAQQLQFREDVPVDEVVLGRIDPVQPRHRLPECEEGGGDEVPERDQDGRFAPRLLDDAPLVVDARDGGVGRAVSGQARHVAGRPVGETCPDDELLLASGILEYASRGRHDQPHQRGRVRGVGSDTRGHPVAEDSVTDVVGPHAPAPLVGGYAGPLQEDQARLGLERIGAPGAVLAGQGLEVEGRIVAAQTEPESVLARGRAVAGPLVAARLGQRGQNLVLELDGMRLPGVADLDHRLHLARPEAYADLGLAVAARLDPASGMDGQDRRVRAHPATFMGQVRTVPSS